MYQNPLLAVSYSDSSVVEIQLLVTSGSKKIDDKIMIDHWRLESDVN